MMLRATCAIRGCSRSMHGVECVEHLKNIMCTHSVLWQISQKAMRTCVQLFARRIQVVTHISCALQ